MLIRSFAILYTESNSQTAHMLLVLRIKGRLIMANINPCDLYLNDANRTLCDKVFKTFDQSTLNSITVLRRVRSALISQNMKFSAFSFPELSDALVKDGMDSDACQHIMTGLALYFDEFDSLDFSAIEDFEYRLIALSLSEKIYTAHREDLST